MKGRPAGGAVDAFVFTERGVYRTGETVFATALLRDGNGAAIAGVPLTLVVRRPDGVEYRRAMVEDQGLGGRALPVPILPGAMRGTWRIAAYTDPKGAAIGEASFLVEDYIPERLEVRLAPRSASHARPAGGDRFLGSLPLRRPGADLEVSGEVVVGASEGHGIKGLEGFAVGLDDEQVEASTVEIEAKAKTDAQLATLQVPIQEVAAPRPTRRASRCGLPSRAAGRSSAA